MYNLIVIGGGSAGLMVAAGAAGLGARVALVEMGAMGGECLNTGCVPSKTLIRSAHTAYLKAHSLHGLDAAPVTTDWAAIAGRVRSVVAAIAPHDSVERFRALGVEVFEGRGRLISATGVEVVPRSGSARPRLEAKALVLATGSAPAVPPIPGLAEAGYLTNENVFEELGKFGDTGRPARIAVLGGGPIGLELAQALARLGARVTVIEALERALPREDAEAGNVVTDVLREEGVELFTGTRATAVEVTGKGASRAKRLRLDGPGGTRFLDADHVIVATGRTVKVQGLGLEAAGVAFTQDGVTVDAQMRTSSPSVYACGDVAGPYRFTHMANQQARVVIQNALFPIKAKMDYGAVPWCTFTDPEVARVGLSEADAAARNLPVRALRVDFAANDRAACDGDTRGFVKILTPLGRDDILGAVVVGAHAGELIHTLIVAIRSGLRLRDLAGTVHIYPTLSEIFRRAGDESRKAGFTPVLQRLVKGYLAWRRS